MRTIITLDDKKFGNQYYHAAHVEVIDDNKIRTCKYVDIDDLLVALNKGVSKEDRAYYMGKMPQNYYDGSIRRSESGELDADLTAPKMKKYFLKEFNENVPSWTRLLWKNFDNIKETAYYLEGGDIYLLRNKKIGYFLQFCEKYGDIVEIHLSEETRVMNQVIEVLMKPLCYENIREEGRIGIYQYLYFDVGSNGYEYLGFGALNPNWIINCYVFLLLMDDFIEKIQQLFEVYPELRICS